MTPVRQRWSSRAIELDSCAAGNSRYPLPKVCPPAISLVINCSDDDGRSAPKRHDPVIPGWVIELLAPVTPGQSAIGSVPVKVKVGGTVLEC